MTRALLPLRTLYPATFAALAAFAFATVPTSATAKDRTEAQPSTRRIQVHEDHSSTKTLRRDRPLSAGERKSVEALRALISKEPKTRKHHLLLVRRLMDLGQAEEALKAAREWRERDAYNLVVVRLIGDIQSELGRHREALRTYSAVVELLAGDADAQRALGAVLKQGGRLQEAQARLQAASELRPEDARLRFELADLHLRQGEGPQAAALFEQIINDEKTPKKLSYPAKQRLAQLLTAKRLRLETSGKKSQEARQIHARVKDLKISGGVENDIKIYLTWDTDRTDVDLWVTDPHGEKIFYQNRTAKNGGALFDDVTDGYGPESFSQKKADAGEYSVQVQFFGTSRRTFREARGEVVILVNEGTATERRHTIPYRLKNPKDVVTVAKINVGSKASRGSK